MIGITNAHTFYNSNNNENSDIVSILQHGFINGTIEFSNDLLMIISTAEDGRVLTRSFSDDFQTITSILEDDNGTMLAKRIVEINNDNNILNSTLVYY